MDHALNEKISELKLLIDNLLDDLDEITEKIKIRQKLIEQYNEIITDMSNKAFKEDNESIRKYLLNDIIIYNDEIDILKKEIEMDQKNYNIGFLMLKKNHKERKALLEKLKENDSNPSYSISIDKDGSLLVHEDEL